MSFSKSDTINIAVIREWAVLKSKGIFPLSLTAPKGMTNNTCWKNRIDTNEPCETLKY